MVATEKLLDAYLGGRSWGSQFTRASVKQRGVSAMMNEN